MGRWLTLIGSPLRSKCSSQMRARLSLPPDTNPPEGVVVKHSTADEPNQERARSEMGYTKLRVVDDNIFSQCNVKRILLSKADGSMTVRQYGSMIVW